MKYKVLEAGYYNLKLRKPGTILVTQKPVPEPHSWLELISDSTEGAEKEASKSGSKQKPLTDPAEKAEQEQAEKLAAEAAEKADAESDQAEAESDQAAKKPAVKKPAVKKPVISKPADK